MRLLLDASPLTWPRSGSRTYVESLLAGLDAVGAAGHVDLLTPSGYTGRSVVAATAGRPGTRRPLRYAWAWEQTTGARGGDVLFRPYVAPAGRRDQSFALLDVLTWLPAGRPPTWPGRLVADRVAANARRAELVVAISDFTRDEGVEHLGLDPTRVVTVRLAAGPAFRPGAPTTVRLPDRPYVLYAGGYGGRKRPELLLAAFGASRALRESVGLVLVGTPPPELVRAAQDAGARPVVAGAVDEPTLAGLYAHAAASCYLSDYEGYGLPPVESYASGCPVVCSHLPSVREVLGNRATYVGRDPVEVGDALVAAIAGPRPAGGLTRTWSDVARETWSAHRAVWSGLPPLSDA